MTDANLHVYATYDPISSTLTAALYNTNNIPNPFPASVIVDYNVSRNGGPSNDFLGSLLPGNPALIPVEPPIACTDFFNIFATYTFNGIPQPPSFLHIVVGLDFVIGNNFLVQTPNLDGTVTLTVVPPIGITPINVTWAYNYDLFTPFNPLTVIATKNGIYEVAFQGLEDGLTYYSAIEVTTTSPTMYVKILGSDGNIYGIFGTPRTVTNLFFVPVDANAPFRYKVYVNNLLFSNNPFISLQSLSPGDLITIIIIDCCNIRLIGHTFLLSCGLPIPPRIGKENNQIQAITNNIFDKVKRLTNPPKPKKKSN